MYDYLRMTELELSEAIEDDLNLRNVGKVLQEIRGGTR